MYVLRLLSLSPLPVASTSLTCRPLPLPSMATDDLLSLGHLQLAGPDMLIDGPYEEISQEETRSETVNISPSPDEQSEDGPEPQIRADNRKSDVVVLHQRLIGFR
jgi:hypothetical protein